MSTRGISFKSDFCLANSTVLLIAEPRIQTRPSVLAMGLLGGWVVKRDEEYRPPHPPSATWSSAGLNYQSAPEAHESPKYKFIRLVVLC